MTNHLLYAGGLQLNFFPDKDLEKCTNPNSSDGCLIQARNVWRILMMGWRKEWYQLISWKTLRAVFIRHDPVLIQALATEFQNGFLHVFEQLRVQAPLSETAHRQAELYLDNCLSYLPFTEPQEGKIIKIPRFVDGAWQLIDYRVQPIELTDTNKKMASRDRVYVFGLDPVSQKKAGHLLILPGTTYPAGQGFIHHIDSDFDAWRGTGEKLYFSGKERIEQWIKQCSDKPEAIGVSLGGAIALIMAADIGNQMKRAHAINPVGLALALWGNRPDNWDSFSEDEKPEVIVQRQVDDIVSTFGLWKKDWIFLQSHTDSRHKGSNGLVNHPLNLAGFENTWYERRDPDIINKERYWRNIVFYKLLRALFYFTVITPLRFVIIPCLRVCASIVALAIKHTAAVMEKCWPLVVKAGGFLLSAVAFSFTILLNAAAYVGKLLFDGIARVCHGIARGFATVADGVKKSNYKFFQDESDDNLPDDIESATTSDDSKCSPSSGDRT